MIQRRFDESNDEWNERLRLTSYRDVVRAARDRHREALDVLRMYAWRARFVTATIALGALGLAGVVGVVLLELWFDGFAPLLGLTIPLTVVPALVVGPFLVEYEQRAERLNAVRRTGRAYQEAYAEYIDAGGGGQATDGLLSISDGLRS